MPPRWVRLPGVLGLLAAAAAFPIPAPAHRDKPHPPGAISTPQEAARPESAERFTCPMCETVRRAEPGACPLCGMALVRAAATGAETRGDPATVSDDEPEALMPGVSDGLFYVGALGILVLSFVLVEASGQRAPPHRPRGFRWNLLRIPGVAALLRSRSFPAAVQIPVVGLLGIVIATGLFGNPAPDKNIAPTLTWTLWWTWLALAILFLGKIWCTVCPWAAIADWMRRLGRNGKTLGLGLPWPRALRNIWAATALFVLLTWLELGYGVTAKPWMTAALGLVMVAAAIGVALVYERQAFCRYACLVGRVSGLYALFAGSELRASDHDTCRRCATKDCYRGNDLGKPCPTHQFLGTMDKNTYCILCMECVKSCPEDNVAWNLRPLGADLRNVRRPRADEAYLSVVMLSMSAFHGLTMTPAWDRIVEAIRATTGVGDLAAFTVGMAAMLALPLVIYAGVCVAMRRFSGDRKHGVRSLFVRFSYSLLPIALFYHLAHNVQHMFFEGKRLLRVASDPFGWGWDLFGTASMPIDATLPVGVSWALQVGLVLAGHVWGIAIAHRTARALYPEPRAATASQIPMLAAMLLFSFQSLWLLAQPMLMRTAM